MHKLQPGDLVQGSMYTHTAVREREMSDLQRRFISDNRHGPRRAKSLFCAGHLENEAKESSDKKMLSAQVQHSVIRLA